MRKCNGKWWELWFSMISDIVGVFKIKFSCKIEINDMQNYLVVS